MLWENLREEEFDSAIEKSGGLCIIPIGCLEKHGQHLPVGMDSLVAKDIALRATEIENAMVFDLGPWVGEVSTFHCYDKPEEQNMRGCIGIKQDLLLRIFEAICDEIARNGFDKILFLNNHGGNVVILKHFMRCQSYTKKPYAIFNFYRSREGRPLPYELERNEKLQFLITPYSPPSLSTLDDRSSR